MILPAQALTTANIRCAAMVLTPHIVNPLSMQPHQGPVRTVITVGSHDITALHIALLLSKQGHFPCGFPLIGSHAQRRQRPTGQVKNGDQSSDRKPSARLLATLLGVGLLLGRRIGPGHRGAIDDFDAAAFPLPGVGSLITQALATLTRQ